MRGAGAGGGRAQVVGEGGGVGGEDGRAGRFGYGAGWRAGGWGVVDCLGGGWVVDFCRAALRVLASRSAVAEGGKRDVWVDDVGHVDD